MMAGRAAWPEGRHLACLRCCWAVLLGEHQHVRGKVNSETQVEAKFSAAVLPEVRAIAASLTLQNAHIVNIDHINTLRIPLPLPPPPPKLRARMAHILSKSLKLTSHRKPCAHTRDYYKEKHLSQ